MHTCHLQGSGERSVWQPLGEPIVKSIANLARAQELVFPQGDYNIPTSAGRYRFYMQEPNVYPAGQELLQVDILPGPARKFELDVASAAAYGAGGAGAPVPTRVVHVQQEDAKLPAISGRVLDR